MSLTAQTFRRRKRLISWTTGLAACFLLLTGIVLPRLLRPMLEERISLALRSPSQVASLAFNPLTLTLTASDIAVPYPGDAGMFLRMDRFVASLSLFSLFRLEPRISELRLDRPVINLTLFEDGRFSPQLFLDEQDTGPSGNVAVFPCVIQNFSINNGAVTFRDHKKGSTQLVENIQFAVPFASTLPEDHEIAVTPRFSATVNGRHLSMAAETRPFSKSLLTEFTLRTEELELDKFHEYIAPYTILKLASGDLSTALTLQISREAGERIRFHLATRTTIRNLELTGPQGAVCKAASAEVDMEIRPGMQHIVINELFLDSPEITARRAADGGIDWQKFFTTPNQDAPNQAAPKQNESSPTPPAIAVTKARIANGAISWHDASVPGFAPYTVRNIKATLSNFDSSGEGKTDFSLALGEGQATFAATGSVSLKPLKIEASVNMERMPFTPFSPYLRRMTGVTPSGALGLKGNFSVEHGTRTLVRLGGISLHDLSVIIPEQGTPLLTARQLAASEIQANVSARSITVGAITGTGVNANPTLGKDGQLVLKMPAKQNSAPAPDWQASIGSVRFDSTSVTLTDLSLREKATLPLNDIKINASTLSTQPGAQWAANLSTRPGRHGLLRLEAKGTLNPLAVSFRFKADKADLVLLSPYIKHAVHLTLADGLINADISGHIKTGKSGRFRVDAAGDAGLHGISLTDAKKEVLGWGRLKAEKFSYRNVPRNSAGTFSAEKLILNGPRLAVIIGEDGRSNIHRMLFPQNASPANKPPATGNPSAGPGMVLSLGGARVTSGEIGLRDERLQPPYSVRVESIRMETDKLSSDPNTRCELRGNCRLNGSPIVFDGAINPLVTPVVGELTLDVNELDLAAFSRYAAKFTGHPIRRGELSARLEFALDGSNLKGRNEIVLGKLEVEDRDPTSDAPDMPIKTAISLMKDLSGDISLSLPVSGRLDDPQFHIGGVMGKTVINTMLKTVASPVKLIGGVFSILAPAARQERINFTPGDDRVSRRITTSLTELVESLPKSGVKLELTGASDMREKTDMTMAVVVKKMRQMKYDALAEAERQ
ncbi:MAG: DUF748 domain-containing protein, partial [Deltaproteobacteria bacterium]|nr:DUF748 domain-containing protein [Deltaproteobacteria bacterium]